MTYYASYIDSGHHASLMLSQDLPDGRTIIIAELHFGPNSLSEQYDALGSIAQKTQWVDGMVHSKSSASSVALYKPDTPVRHRTWVISEQEAFQLRDAYAREKGWQIEFEDCNEDGTMFTSNDYHFIKYNCKSFALKLLRKIGIIDAETLANWCVQIPGTKKAALSSLDDEIECPEKQQMMAKTVQQFEKIIALKKIIDDLDDSIEDKILLQAQFQLVQLYISQATDMLHKLGFDPGFHSLLSNIDAHLFDLGETAKQIIEAQQLPELAATFKKVRNSFSEHQLNAERLRDHYRENKIKYFWKDKPTLSARVNLASLSPTDKAMQNVFVKVANFSNGLDDIINLISSELSEVSKQDPVDIVLKNELHQYLGMCLQSNEKLNQIKQEFHKQPRPKEEREAILQSLSLLDKVETEVGNLKRKIGKTKPKTKPVGFIQKCITGITKFFFGTDAIFKKKPKTVLQKRLNAIKKKSDGQKIHNSVLNLFQMKKPKKVVSKVSENRFKPEPS
jgi:hypothetical protein